MQGIRLNTAAPQADPRRSPFPAAMSSEKRCSQRPLEPLSTLLMLVPSNKVEADAPSIRRIAVQSVRMLSGKDARPPDTTSGDLTEAGFDTVDRVADRANVERRSGRRSYGQVCDTIFTASTRM